MLSAEAVFAQLADEPGAVWLDGAGTGWSILSWSPTEVVTEARDWPAAGRALTGIHPPTDVPFAGGCIGYVGYGAGHAVLPVPEQAPTPEPTVWLGRFDGGLCLDHRTATWTAHGTPAFRRRAEQLLAGASELPPPAPPTGTVGPEDRPRFEAGVRRVQDLLAAGDCYQVNLTRAVHVHEVGPSFDAWRRLRHRAPAAYGAYLRLSPTLAVLCDSPELFLEVMGDTVASLPIKGTRPRHPDPATDGALARDLLQATKDQAELTMIVDLVRNDLGRVAVLGSVRAGPREVTAHPYVHHAAQRVHATLRPGLDAWDALAAAFPPGSVTGAPKVRACQRIAELEPEPRGVYCGAVGFVDGSGDATFNVAIRTAIVDGAHARYHVGGGIVIRSDPAEEWQETVDKGTALRSALVRGREVGSV